MISSILRLWATYCGSERPTGPGASRVSGNKVSGLASTDGELPVLREPRTVALGMLQEKSKLSRSVVDGNVIIPTSLHEGDPQHQMPCVSPAGVLRDQLANQWYQ